MPLADIGHIAITPLLSLIIDAIDIFIITLIIDYFQLIHY
jgi:hypothetical protein